MKTFAINIVGYIKVDDNYEGDVIEQMLNRKSMTEYFPSFNIVDISQKEMTGNYDKIDIKKVQKSRKIKLGKK